VNIIVWLLVGLFAGAIARLLIPGRDPIGVGGTLLLGLAGSLLGGWLATVLLSEGSEFSPAGLLGSIIGAALLLLIFRAVARPRRV
jgi:uncharacterized membrane protein YeaQ/YmgE (transglycosylase-associated protein family)